MGNGFKPFKCFSINLLRFISAHGIKPMSKGLHENGKSYWIFNSDEISDILLAWTNNKPEQLK